MKKESLIRAIGVIIEALRTADIDDTDKLELMLNLSHLLEHYEEDIQLLKQKRR